MDKIIYALGTSGEDLVVRITRESHFVKTGFQEDNSNDPLYKNLLARPEMEMFPEMMENVLEVPASLNGNPEMLRSVLDSIPGLEFSQEFQEFIDSFNSEDDEEEEDWEEDDDEYDE